MAAFSKLLRSLNRQGKVKKPKNQKHFIFKTHSSLQGLKIKAKARLYNLAFLILIFAQYFPTASASHNAPTWPSASNGSVQSRWSGKEEGKVSCHTEFLSWCFVPLHKSMYWNSQGKNNDLSFSCTSADMYGWMVGNEAVKFHALFFGYVKC